MKSQIIGPLDPLWLETLLKVRHDIYHLPQYNILEAKRYGSKPEALLISEGEKLFFVPYLIGCHNTTLSSKNTNEKILDVTSPYGYPGILLSAQATNNANFINSAIDELINILQEKGVCSAFLRLHPLLNNGFNQVYQEDGCKFLGETIGIDLRLSEAELWQQTRPQYRRTINHCNRMGLKARICSPQNYLREFTSLYQETMNRVHAAENYYFKEEYFHNLIEGLGEKLHLCIVEFENKIISAGLLTEYNGIVQSHLRGTKTEFMKYSPSKLMFNFIRTWAKQRGNEILHLGGGVGSCKDSLYQFKAGFSKQRYPFLTLQLIIDKTKYAEMVESHAKYLGINSSELLQANYFPAYRACS